MSTDDSIQTRQENEIAALEAIYGSALRDLRKKAAWNRWTPLNLAISLVPQRGSSGDNEAYVRVDLHVKCPETYPNAPPTIKLENGKGISQSLLVQLKAELETLAVKYEGEEVIFQLCQHVEQFLHRHNEPAMTSFYDVMIREKKEQTMKLEVQKRRARDEQRESLMKEVQEREKLLKGEAKLIKEQQGSFSESDSDSDNSPRKLSLTSRKLHNSLSESTSMASCDHGLPVTIDFNGRKVQRGHCLVHIQPFLEAFFGYDVATGESLEITEWKLDLRNRDRHQIVRNLTGIEQELNHLTKLRHVNLVRYMGFAYEFEAETVSVRVLKEFISGINCNSSFLRKTFKSNIDDLRRLTRDVLAGLEYIHRQNVVYKDLNAGSIKITGDGVVKLSDYSIHRRLLDLVNGTTGNYNKKSDIFDFGRLVLTLLGLSDDPDAALETPPNSQNDLYDLLRNCLNKEEKERFTAAQLLNHSFFRNATTTEVRSPIDDPEPMARIRSPEPFDMSATSLADSQSRLNRDFEVLSIVGKGGFGDVLKARNRLDNCCYAIKRIKLNPKWEVLNKKVGREVTLLSRLNHENVVRYYYAWIETMTLNIEDGASSVASATVSESGESHRSHLIDKKKLTLDDGLEKLSSAIKNVEVTYDSQHQMAYEDSSDDDDDDDSTDEDEAFIDKFNEDASDSIVFERASNDEEESSSKQADGSSAETATKENTELKLKHLYIVMEFCEKSTLRTAIDANLYLDEDRVWRLFREIVEGLAHIHQQGMIHRDLKPVNIFLDSRGHAKIGDFGLATTIAIRSRHGEIQVEEQVDASKDHTAGNESKTGNIGTVLYVAPEINSGNKSNYNQKVDIYSLGIILFEMCHRPLETNMERIQILSKLRSANIVFPEGFATANPRGHYLIRWLLNHDVSKRPTAQEVLQSKHTPPAVYEERKFQELIRHTLSNPQLKDYRFLISACFEQTITPAQDITYDRDLIHFASTRHLNLVESVKDTCVKVFRQHGGRNFEMPHLMPKCKFYDNVETCVKLMTHFGNVVQLPHDSRIPFARYVALSNITSYTRYSVQRVAKERKVFGFAPREYTECAFDIVTPSKGDLTSDAEVLYVMYEIVNNLPGAKSKNFVIKLNHTDLFHGILTHCGYKDKPEDLLQVLADIKARKVGKAQLQTFLSQHGLPDHMISLLVNLLHVEIEDGKAAKELHSITRKKTGALVQAALSQLMTIIQIAKDFGVEFDFVIVPGLLNHIQQYSGMLCQFVCELKKKNKHDVKDVIAIGGRYNNLIAYFKSIMEQTDCSAKDVTQSAVGITISLDKLVQAVQKDEEDTQPSATDVDVIVCSARSVRPMIEKMKIVKGLTDSGFRCLSITGSNILEIQEQLPELGVAHAIVVKENDVGVVKVISWDRESSFDRFRSRDCSVAHLVKDASRILNARSDAAPEIAQASNALTRSESNRSSYGDKSDGDSSVVHVSFVISKKLATTVRRKYEIQIKSHLDSVIKRHSGLIAIVAVQLDSNVVKVLSAFLDFQNEGAFRKSVDECISKYPKHKVSIEDISEELWQVKNQKTSSMVILYNTSDNSYKVLCFS